MAKETSETSYRADLNFAQIFSAPFTLSYESSNEKLPARSPAVGKMGNRGEELGLVNSSMEGNILVVMN